MINLLFASLVSFGAAPVKASAKVETKLEFVSRFELPAGFKYKKTQVGGLSGAVYNPDTETWILISDDRGRINEPRLYEFKFSSQPFRAEVVGVQFLKKKNQKKWAKNVLDAEGITLLPWANYLISSEGDNNQKPRVMPTLFDAKADGTVVRDFALPDEMLPEPAGHQSKGIPNNMGPEGLTSSEDRKFIWAAMEGVLLQDRPATPDQIRIVQYEMPEAWVIKPTKQFFYPMENGGEGDLVSVRGVSEIFWAYDQVLWVMERGLEINLSGLNHAAQIFEVDLADEAKPLKKRVLLNLSQLQKKIPNFEAMVGGPALPDGRKTLILISDNNFQKNEPTQFWLFAYGEKK